MNWHNKWTVYAKIAKTEKFSHLSHIPNWLFGLDCSLPLPIQLTLAFRSLRLITCFSVMVHFSSNSFAMKTMEIHQNVRQFFTAVWQLLTRIITHIDVSCHSFWYVLIFYFIGQKHKGMNVFIQRDIQFIIKNVFSSLYYTTIVFIVLSTILGIKAGTRWEKSYFYSN